MMSDLGDSPSSSSMDFPEYQPLVVKLEPQPEDNSDDGTEDLPMPLPRRKRRCARIHLIYTFAVGSVCLLSLWFNLSMWARYHKLEAAHKQLREQYELNLNHVHVEKTPYAKLEYETHHAVNHRTGFMEIDQPEEMNKLWEEMNLDPGVVALSDDYAREHNIPLGVRHPWDDTKGVYVLESHHLLHCTRRIHLALTNYRLGRPQQDPEIHTAHCLDALRRDIMCQADDTPWTTNDPAVVDGKEHYQQRKCRNFDALQEWGIKNSACFSYRYINNDTMTREEKFTACPEGSPYMAIVQEKFPDGVGW